MRHVIWLLASVAGLLSCSRRPLPTARLYVVWWDTEFSKGLGAKGLRTETGTGWLSVEIHDPSGQFRSTVAAIAARAPSRFGALGDARALVDMVGPDNRSTTVLFARNCQEALVGDAISGPIVRVACSELKTIVGFAGPDYVHRLESCGCK